MAVVAPFCKFKKTNLKIYIVMSLAFGLYFAYDGYYNKEFIRKHTDIGKPDSTLVFNQKVPPFLFALSAAFAVWFWKVKDKKITADDDAVTFSENDKIPYSSIESINKTHYDSKGFFVIEYKSPDGQKTRRKVSDRTYDNLSPVLEFIVSKISG